MSGRTFITVTISASLARLDLGLWRSGFVFRWEEWILSRWKNLQDWRRTMATAKSG